MEDWKKYVFDPKNPKGFKAYNLLKKILKSENTLLIYDSFFFNELFKKEIWTQDLIDDFWDVPANFSDLSSNEKAGLYAIQFSENEYEEELKRKLGAINKNPYKKYLNHFLESKDSPNRNLAKCIEDIKVIDNFHYFPSSQKISIIGRTPQSFNFIFLASEEASFKKCVNFNPSRSSAVFTLESNFDKNTPLPNNTHPILLKKESDIHILLDFLSQDIQKENAPKSLHKANVYLKNIAIKNYFSLENISLKNWAKQKEIYFLGENGDGKTILLQALVLALRGNQNIGAVTDIVKQNPYASFSLKAETTTGEKYQYQENPKDQKTAFNSVIGYGIDRFRNDSDKKDEVGFLSLFNKETYLENPVKWLQHLDYKETKEGISEISLTQAKAVLIDILEKDVTINVTPDRVTFTEKGTVLSFDQLSDGYQSVIIWVCDLIARLSALQPNAASPAEYSGIVLVDEIGAYLHPKWAYGIVKKLREWFKNLQFIFTTHNPIVILGASEDAIFYKVYKENGKTKVSEPLKDISDLMLNSLVTSPLFNLPTARPMSFQENYEDLSSDDYVYRRIHQKIQEELAAMPNLLDEDVIRMIAAELEKI